jgi:hypothetical protein
LLLNGNKTAVVVAMLLAMLAACDGDKTTATPATTSTSGATPVTIDWSTRVPRTELGDGWTVESCEGDAPLLCLTSAEHGTGFLERSEFPLSSLSYATDDEMKTLNAHARDFYESFVRDRAEGCGQKYELRAIPPEQVEVAGKRGLRYGFAGNRPGEKASERHLNHAFIDGDKLVILGLPAYDDNACVARQGEMTTAAQAALEPLLGPLVAGIELP